MIEMADTAEKIAELINDKERLAKYRYRIPIFVFNCNR
jgi:hypothetical protein